MTTFCPTCFWPDGHCHCRSAQTGERLVRDTDPDTSHDAAEAVELTAPRSEQIAFDYIKTTDGCICSDVVDHTTLEWNSASRRITSLIRKGRVYDTGERLLGHSNRKQRVVAVRHSSNGI